MVFWWLLTLSNCCSQQTGLCDCAEPTHKAGVVFTGAWKERVLPCSWNQHFKTQSSAPQERALLCKQPLHEDSGKRQPQVTQIWHQTTLLSLHHNKFLCGWHRQVGRHPICNEATKELTTAPVTATHPPAAAAWRHVLPKLSGVSMSKPADSTCSLLNKDTMLYFCPS